MWFRNLTNACLLPLPLFPFSFQPQGPRYPGSDHWDRERVAGTKKLPHAAQQVLKPRRDAPDRLVNTPNKDLFSFSVFSSVPETLGIESCRGPRTSWVGLSLGFHTLLLSHRVSQGGVRGAGRNRCFYYPPISLHKRKQSCVLAAQASTLPK